MRIIDYRPGLTLLLAIGLFGCTEQAQQPPTAISNAPTSVADHVAAGVVIDAAWARPTAPVTTVGAAYMTITNHGMSADHLIGMSSPVAARIELHATIEHNGMTHMGAVGELEIAPNDTASMDPGGMHFMLKELSAPLVAGTHFPLTLKFKDAGDITVDVVVQAGG